MTDVSNVLAGVEDAAGDPPPAFRDWVRRRIAGRDMPDPDPAPPVVEYDLDELLAEGGTL